VKGYPADIPVTIFYSGGVQSAAMLVFLSAAHRVVCSYPKFLLHPAFCTNHQQLLAPPVHEVVVITVYFGPEKAGVRQIKWEQQGCVASQRFPTGMRKGKIFIGSLAMNKRSIDGKDKQARQHRQPVLGDDR